MLFGIAFPYKKGRYCDSIRKLFSVNFLYSIIDIMARKPRGIQRGEIKPLSSKLSDAFASSDKAAFLQLLEDVVHAYGPSELSRNAGINRVTLYRYLKGQATLRLDTFEKILAQLGLTIKFVASSPKKRAAQTIDG